MAKVIAIIPKRKLPDAKSLMKALEQGLNEVGDGMLKDYQKTVRTWRNRTKPEFKKRIRKGASYSVEVEAVGKIYMWVSEGTRPHIITPKFAKALAFRGTFKPKTRYKFIGSSNGLRSGKFVYAKRVRHPGSEGRKFHDAIKEKWDALIARIIQKRINQVVRK